MLRDKLNGMIEVSRLKDEKAMTKRMRGVNELIGQRKRSGLNPLGRAANV
jgi:hypothetical protein